MAKQPPSSPPGPDGASAVLVELYSAAQARLREMVLKPPGRTAGSVEFRRGRAADLVRQVDLTLKALGRETDRWIGQAVPASYVEGLRTADRQLREAKVKVPGAALRGSFSVINRQAVQVVANDIAADLGKARKAMGERATKLIRDTAAVKINLDTGELLHTSDATALSEAQINRIIAGGLIEGAPRETIRTLREELRAIYSDRIGIPTKGGYTIEFPVAYYAGMVARTKTREATVLGTHNRLRDAGVDLVRIVGRRSANFCTEFLGMVFSLSGKHKKYPSLASLPQGGPPFHPNCSKSTAAFIEELASEEQKGMAEGRAEARAMLGKTSSQAARIAAKVETRGEPDDDYQDRARKTFVQEQGFEPRSEPRRFADDQVEETRAWGEANYAEWAESLTADQAESVSRFQAGAGRDLNKALWGRRDSAGATDLTGGLKRLGSDMDAVMAKARLPEDVVVYRGMGNRPQYHADGQKMEGAVLPLGGFHCTSLRRQAANRYARGGEHPVVMEIAVPAGTRAAYLSASTRRQHGDDELLIDRSHQLKVLSVVKREGEALFIKTEVVRE